MREVYSSVLERLLVIHYEAQKKQPSQDLVNNEESAWPPRPWPPWDDDDDGDDDDGGKDRPKNATKLAEEVVKFEWKLARASLDLLGHFKKESIQILTVAQRHLIPGSSIHL
jgi:endothelin-converting enzyme